MVVEYNIFSLQITASVKIDLVFEIQFLLKCPFLTVFSKIYRPTKVDVLGLWEVSILFRNSWRFFFCLTGVPLSDFLCP